MLKRLYKTTAWVVLITFGFQALGGNVWADVISNQKSEDRSQRTEDRQQPKNGQR